MCSCCEALVVLEELEFALCRRVLHADAGLRSCFVKPVLLEALEDRVVHVLHVGRRPIAVRWVHQKDLRLQLLRLTVDARPEDSLDLLRKLEGLGSVGVEANRRRSYCFHGARGHDGQSRY